MDAKPIHFAMKHTEPNGDYIECKVDLDLEDLATFLKTVGDAFNWNDMLPRVLDIAELGIRETMARAENRRIELDHLPAGRPLGTMRAISHEVIGTTSLDLPRTITAIRVSNPSPTPVTVQMNYVDEG